MKILILICILFFSITSLPGISSTADKRIHVVGSSTVFPFAKLVANQFTKLTDYEEPLEESTGSGEGFRRFCAEPNASPDITNASRRIRINEMNECMENDVGDIVEIKIGYDGITLANAKDAPYFNLNHRHLFLALAETVPYNGELVANPYKKWMEISLTLPSFKIRVFGPPPTSGTRDSFISLVLEKGCDSFPEIRSLKEQSPERHQEVCGTLRSDGVYVDSGEDDHLIVEELADDPSALGIFGYGFLDRNRDLIKGSGVAGVRPDYFNISSGRYSLVRPLYIYIKKDRVGVVPGMREYIDEFTNEWSLGPDGYLVDEGLVPLPKEERKRNYYIARELRPLSIQDLAP
jgi:phosphate transport system substrate-binding protein